MFEMLKHKLSLGDVSFFTFSWKEKNLAREVLFTLLYVLSVSSLIVLVLLMMLVPSQREVIVRVYKPKVPLALHTS